MSVNGVNNKTNNYSAYDSYSKSANADSKDKAKKTTKEDAAAVYESSSKSSSKTNSALVAQLKADSQNRMAQMQSLVQKMFSQQGIKIGTANDMWKTLASGKFEATPEAIAQAKDDISENGYWGVSQTSERIFSFAMALSGGDEKNMEKMKAAFEKGFKEATKSWGKSLPGISNDTYDSVMKKFDDWSSKNSTTSQVEA